MRRLAPVLCFHQRNARVIEISLKIPPRFRHAARETRRLACPPAARLRTNGPTWQAGLLGDAGWSVYFPKRDVGFDFIAVKELLGQVVIRPVQVKGKYPSGTKGNKVTYGYIGKLSQLHPEMVR